MAASLLHSRHPHHSATVSTRGVSQHSECGGKCELFCERIGSEWEEPSLVLTLHSRCRLQEGYHVTSADNGVVTLAAQLTVQVLVVLLSHV